ncbi:hypothetical protein HYALB_00008147, partial [Hymenoscyphus albidus]
LSTQFWSTYTGLESEGQVLPKGSWGVHGLWPDFCDGSFGQYCDLSRQYDPVPSPNTTTGTPSGTPVPPYEGPSITTSLEAFGKFDLIAWMNKYIIPPPNPDSKIQKTKPINKKHRFWINQNFPNPILWAHEFSKHATCFSTFSLPCYGPLAPPNTEVLDFFETTISYFLALPTYSFLAAADILPSNSTTYTLSCLQDALRSAHRAMPYIGCSGPAWNSTEEGKGSLDSGRTVLSEVWYYYHVLGRVQDGKGEAKVPVEAGANGGSVSNCVKVEGGLRYPERSVGSEV